ncbi:MAG: Mur ligase family protein, partial [Cellvibrionaceae bacterium]|nr:Mur ligase family protein [Cellvibrionaceae bacterium]
AKVQFVLLEVGLGGRLDAVNIIDPDVAILTSVALDHQDWLGDNLEQIATEKAGIFRPGRPALCAMFEPPAAVADSARRLGSQLYQAGEDFNWQRLDNGGWQIQLQQQSLQLPALTLPLPSVVAALQTLEILKLLPAEQDCQRALSGLILRGRCQPMEFAGRRWVLDVAHNPAASEHLLQQLAWTAGGSARRQLIVAMMADKEAAEIMAPWLGRAARVYACELANNPRAISAKNLYSVLQRQGFAAEVADSVASAMETALAASAEGDEILIMGSFFTVAAALAYFSEQGCSVQ